MGWSADNVKAAAPLRPRWLADYAARDPPPAVEPRPNAQQVSKKESGKYCLWETKRYAITSKNNPLHSKNVFRKVKNSPLIILSAISWHFIGFKKHIHIFLNTVHLAHLYKNNCKTKYMQRHEQRKKQTKLKTKTKPTITGHQKMKTSINGSHNTASSFKKPPLLLLLWHYLKAVDNILCSHCNKTVKEDITFSVSVFLR